MVSFHVGRHLATGRFRVGRHPMIWARSLFSHAIAEIRSFLEFRYDVLSAPFLNDYENDCGPPAKDAAGVYCSVCGEMAKQIRSRLWRLSVSRLIAICSSSGASFGRIKSMVRSVHTEEIADYMKLLLRNRPGYPLQPQLIPVCYMITGIENLAKVCLNKAVL